MLTIAESKAFLSHYANTTPKPSKAAFKAMQAEKQKRNVATSLSDLEPLEVIKLKSIVKMAGAGYEYYTPDEIRTVQNAPNLIDLYNTIKGTDLWHAASKKGTLRINSIRYQNTLK